MIPIEPLSLESKLFFLSAAEFGGRLFRGPDAPDGQALDDWLELAFLGPAELANMLPENLPVIPGRQPDFGLPALLARLSQTEADALARELPETFNRLFHPATAAAQDAAMARQLALDLERLIALLARGFLDEAPDMAARAGALCRDVLVPRFTELAAMLAAKDGAEVFAAAAAVMLAVTGDLAAKL